MAGKRNKRRRSTKQNVSKKIRNNTLGYKTKPKPNPSDIVIAPWNHAIIEDAQKGDRDYSFENFAALLCKQLGLQTGTTTKVDLAVDLRVHSFQLWGFAAEKSIQVAAASSITGEYIYLRDFPGRNMFSSIGYVFPSSFFVSPQQLTTPTWKTNIVNVDAGDGQNWLIRVKVLWRANNTAQITHQKHITQQMSSCKIDYEMI